MTPERRALLRIAYLATVVPMPFMERLEKIRGVVATALRINPDELRSYAIEHSNQTYYESDSQR